MTTRAQQLRIELGRGIKAARTQRGLKLREASSQAGLSLSYWSEIENGKKQASFEMIDSICRVLDISLASLFTYMLKDMECPS